MLPGPFQVSLLCYYSSSAELRAPFLENLECTMALVAASCMAQDLFWLSILSCTVLGLFCLLDVAGTVQLQNYQPEPLGVELQTVSLDAGADSVCAWRGWRGRALHCCFGADSSFLFSIK